MVWHVAMGNWIMVVYCTFCQLVQGCAHNLFIYRSHIDWPITKFSKMKFLIEAPLWAPSPPPLEAMWLPFVPSYNLLHASMHVEVRPNNMRQIKMLGKTRTQRSFHFSEVIAWFSTFSSSHELWPFLTWGNEWGQEKGFFFFFWGGAKNRQKATLIQISGENPFFFFPKTSRQISPSFYVFGEHVAKGLISFLKKNRGFLP